MTLVVAWTSTDAVIAALGTGAAPPADDPWLAACVDAANAAAFRKREEAGYLDDDTADAAAPSPDIGMGATLWAVALWRERQSTDGFASFEDLATFAPTGGSWATIRRMLAIGRARVDSPIPHDSVTVAALRSRRRRRRGVSR